MIADLLDGKKNTEGDAGIWFMLLNCRLPRCDMLITSAAAHD